MCRASAMLVYSSASSPSEEEITITRMLDKVLKRSDAVDKESLCILAGQRVSILAHVS
jgi:exosome complex component RRP45